MSKEFYKNPILKVNNGSIIIYYFHKDVCRYPTGYSISSEKNKNGKFVEWDYKNNFLKPSSKDYNIKSEKIKSLLEKSKDIIKNKFEEQSIVLTGKELFNYLDSDYTLTQNNKFKTLREHYETFLKSKKIRFSEKPQSLKDYTSLKNLLESYEIYHNETLTVRMINDDFVDSLISFTRIEHPKTLERNGNTYNLKTKGKLSQNTLRKRLDNLREFKDYLVKKSIINPTDCIDNRRNKLTIPKKISTTLSITEIHNLYQIDFQNERMNKTKDLFVFICLTGMRWSDIETFDSRFIKKDGQNWYYETRPLKTENSSSVICSIPLCKIVKDILEKYELNLQSIITTNQDFNRELKLVTKKSNLFNDLTRVKDKHTNSFKYRHELITAHKGRDSFITNLIEVVPINELMKYTGHTKVSTLMNYVDKSRKISFDYIKIFDNE